MNDEFEPDSYFDSCSICGTSQLFARRKQAIRETYNCSQCKASLRERSQASVIIAYHVSSEDSTLAQLVQRPDFCNIRIYEPGTTGAFRKFFMALPHYHQSDFYPVDTRASASAQIPHQDLEATTYPDSAFDLMISSDILEHVRRPHQAFREFARLLRPGGKHIFTVPLQDPLRTKSIVRVDTTNDTDQLLLPAHYHGNGKGGRSLVYTDFGADIVEMLEDAGLQATLERPKLPSKIANRVITVVATRR